jgi:hypothetical protein
MPSRFEKLEIAPERVQVMKTAFYKACAQLGLSPTSDRLTDILVTKIIDLCMAGERDPDRLSEDVVTHFRAKGTGPEQSGDAAKFKEYARACREMRRGIAPWIAGFSSCTTKKWGAARIIETPG